MRYALALLAAGLMSVMSAQAQTATDLNEGQRVTTSATTGVFTLSWWGQAGRTYLIQQSFDLMTWQYVPTIVSGANGVSGMNFSCSDSRQFWRLRYTDQVYSGTAEAADFDYDGVSNQAELNAGLDVFSADTDGDSLPDGWELANNLDAKSTLGMNGAQGDPDGDELTNVEEYNSGTNPRAADTDADTLSDYDEAYVYLTNPSLADSDNDGLSDAAEVLIYLTNPMNWDTDGDSLSDSAEVNTHLTNPLSKDSDNDGLNDDAEINTYQTNPNAADSDNDGISDKSEIKQGTNAKSASNRPAFESVEVVGDGAAGVRKTKQLTITLPQGERSYMVVIAAYSEEYPRFTGYQSEFDDVVDWKITPAGGTVTEGEKHVNELHGEWQQSETNGTTYLGLSPVAIVKIETIQGKASGTTSVQIELGAKNVSDASLPSTLAASVVPIDLKIWNSQDATTEVADKTGVGAFTIANLNDTDGDGTIDKDDNDVPGEKDLMKLYVGGYVGLTGKVKLTVKSGTVKFWEHKEKKTEIPQTGGAVFFDIQAGGMNKTIWIEAWAVSGAVRDIEIWEGYQPTQGILQDGTDKVKATAIWVDPGANPIITAGNAVPGNLNDTTAIATFQNQHDSKFGIFNASPGKAQFSYSIGFEFKVKPTGVGNEPGIKFDVSRQREIAAWVKDNQGWFGNPAGTFPTTPDEPNDDNHSADEDNTPTNDHIYSLDNPIVPFLPAPAERTVKRGNFREFVRVRFDGQAFQNQNGTVEGSRCANFQDWRMRGDLSNSNGVWNLSPGGSNELQGGHVPLGAHP